MKTLNKARPFGKIAGEAFIPDGCDRPAHYEQGGRFFDAHGKLLASSDAVDIDDDEDDGSDPSVMTVAELLYQADRMDWRAFKKAARDTLGEDCPGTKALIIDALKAAQKQFDTRAAKKAKERGQTSPQQSSGIDLVAWARGQKEYLWGDVRKEIRLQFHANVSERVDAVELLIKEGKITASEARQDVLA